MITLSVSKRESVIPSKEEIERQLHGERDQTGFDVLIEVKRRNILMIRQMLDKNPTLTRREVSSVLKVDMRTVSRYFSELRKHGFKVKFLDTQTELKRKRVARLKRIFYEHPDWNREQVRKAMNVSWRTLYKYLKEVETVK